MFLELKRVIETKLKRVGYRIGQCYYFNSCLKHLYISNKMVHFSYKSWCGMMSIEAFKKAGLGYRQMA